VPSATSKQLAQRKAFGVRVREERLKRGITQEQLAHQSELDRSYVGQVERGERNVSLDNIYRLANALSIEADSLV
jgi:transcriptional regulator with XRE-family HTH domain